MCQSATPHWVKWAAAVLNCYYGFILSGFTPRGRGRGRCRALWKRLRVTWMITKLISLQTCFNVPYPGSLINILQNRPLCPFSIWSECRGDDGIDQSQLLSAPQCRTWRPHYLQQPWRLCFYWFLELQFYYFFLPVVGFQSQQRAEKTARRSVCLRLTAVNHVSAKGEEEEVEEEAIHSSFISLSFTAPLCLLVWLSRSLWLSILHTLSSDSHE